ncbi:hypothetical protein MA16_Dca019215 [Dendrobium catenatum]|uniref:Uncharacterized protein n=1 Tax=Dendrobium catenatum TaxID=906689 RepID=A0A2I0WKD7_9ASPA|nr:hypothetical protein MA16_Dca019215 [Dendrobium catenatum]
MRKPNLALGNIIAYVLESKYILQYPAPPNFQPAFYSNNSFHALHSTCLHQRDGEAQQEEEEALTPTRAPQLDQMVERFDQWELCKSINILRTLFTCSTSMTRIWPNLEEAKGVGFSACFRRKRKELGSLPAFRGSKRSWVLYLTWAGIKEVIRLLHLALHEAIAGRSQFCFPLKRHNPSDSISMGPAVEVTNPSWDDNGGHGVIKCESQEVNIIFYIFF